MSAQKGRDVLVKIYDGSGYVSVAGLRARTISLNAKTVDATDSDSSGAWRELLAGAGVKSATVTGAGIFRDAASDALVRTAFFEGTAPNFSLTLPDFGVITGPFQVSNLDYAGDFDGEATFAMTLVAAGQLSFVAD